MGQVRPAIGAGRGGVRPPITTIGAGECFGEMALFDREPRSSSIRAVTDTIVLKIEEESFYDLISGNIKIIQGIVKVLSRRLRQSSSIEP